MAGDAALAELVAGAYKRAAREGWGMGRCKQPVQACCSVDVYHAAHRRAAGWGDGRTLAVRTIFAVDSSRKRRSHAGRHNTARR